MKIAVSTRLLLPNKLEGIGWFTHEIFRRLVKRHPEIEWVFLFDRPYDPAFVYADNVRPLIIGPPTRHPLLWYIWLEWRLPRCLRKIDPDLFISPDGFVSLRSKVKTLNVIHDINFEHFPSNVPATASWYYRHFFRKFAKRAERLASVSEYSRQDIIKTYGVEGDKIDLVYNGCGEFFHALDEPEKDLIRSGLTNGQPYFIFVGALNPRKNITGMLHAYSTYRQKGGQSKFVIVGDKMFWDQAVAQVYDHHAYKDDIIFTGRLEGDALSRVLASAEALLFVSHFEGFGIPIIEAFMCHTPVITSTTTSMPEVAGDAALLCDPGDHEAIARAMNDIEKKDIRSSLIAKGIERVKLFNWDRSADMMWESIQRVLNQK